MNKLNKSMLLTAILLFGSNAHSQELSYNEIETIKQDCRRKSTRDLEVIRGYGIKTLTYETLIEKCTKRSKEVAVFNKKYPNKNTQEIYDQTVSDLNNKLLEFPYSENNKLNICFNSQLTALYIANRADEIFLRNALITANSILSNNCNN